MVPPTLTKTLAVSAMVLVPATAALHALTRRSAEDGSRYANAARLSLRPAPSPESAPIRAEILRGATLQVVEERDGWARVNLWGWVPSDQLSTERPDVSGAEQVGPSGPLRTGAQTESRRPDMIADVDQKGQRITDLRKATRLSVTTVTDPIGKDQPAIVVGLGFLAHSVLVSFEEPSIDVELTLHEKKILAGTRTHGPRLYAGKATLSRWEDGLAGTRKITIPLSAIDLSSVRSEGAILVARATLPNGYVVYGRDYDVVLRRDGEQPPADAASKDAAPPAEPLKKPEQGKDG